MRIGDARAIAVEWVRQHASGRPDFRGAFFSGSTAAMAPEAELPASSDVDVVVVLAGASAPPKPGKLLLRGVLIEITYLAFAELDDADHVAASYHLAPSFARDTIIADPTGRLQELHRAISATFNDPAAIERRCESVFAKILAGLDSIDPAAPWHDQVAGWLFPTGITTHVVLVAARQNPTVRLRYLAARGVLQSHGLTDLYPPLLDLLGCRDVAAAQVQRHLDALAAVFDAAAAVAKTPFPFSSDITAAARPIAIDGSQALIDAGDHREAVFWLVATFARCMKILAADAPPAAFRDAEPAFRAAVADLVRVRELDDLPHRAGAVRGFLPRLRSAAQAIIERGIDGHTPHAPPPAS